MPDDDLIITDGRQSVTAAAVQRGVRRMLLDLEFVSLSEFTLKSGRRADLMAINRKGDIWIIEIKSSFEDFRADAKWPEYWDHCDQLFFAVPVQLDHGFVPETTGLILADAWGAEILRTPPEPSPLPAARRKAVTAQFARAAAMRLHRLEDPGALS